MCALILNFKRMYKVFLVSFMSPILREYAKSKIDCFVLKRTFVGTNKPWKLGILRQSTTFCKEDIDLQSEVRNAKFCFDFKFDPNCICIFA